MNTRPITTLSLIIEQQQQQQQQEGEVDNDMRLARLEFAIFLKILLRYLKQQKLYLLLEKVRNLVMRCTYQNRKGNPYYSPLVQTLQSRLRKLVGENIWNRVKTYTVLYIQRFQPLVLQNEEIKVDDGTPFTKVKIEPV